MGTRTAVESGWRSTAAASALRERLNAWIRHERHKLAYLRLSSIPRRLVRRVKKAVWHTTEVRMYAMEAAAVHHLANPRMMKRDCLDDVQEYEPAEAWQPSKEGFLREVAEGMVAGAHIYTYAEGGRLLHHGWLTERQPEAVLAEVGQRHPLPPDSAVLAAFYTHPRARGRGLYRMALAQMLHDATSIAGATRIYVWVTADNKPSRHVIEKLGFVYQGSFFQRKRPTGTARWATRAPES